MLFLNIEDEGLRSFSLVTAYQKITLDNHFSGVIISKNLCNKRKKYSMTVSHRSNTFNCFCLDFYDHICDHRHAWNTWRQDATRARKVIFAVAERSEKRQNDRKNVQVALGVVEAASSSLVTQTISSVHIREPSLKCLCAEAKTGKLA